MKKSKPDARNIKAQKHIEQSTRFHEKSIHHHGKAMEALKEVIKGNKIEANGENKLKKHLNKIKK